jgi:TRAP transporter TAXI family solute receptor
VAGLLAWSMVAAGCARGADETQLTQELQSKLDRDVKPGLFEVVGVRREGSAPLPKSDAGTARVIVYFNATLRLREDYQFGGWDQLGASSVGYVLGATEKGIFGLKPENRAGDIVRAYGSAVYEKGDQGWVIGATTQAATAAPPNIEGTAPPSRSKQLIDKLAAMIDGPPPGVPTPQDEIIADELARASENIERRMKRREHVFTLATGPESGQYARFGAALVAAVNEAAPSVQLRQRHSEGSIENVRLLERGEADYAIVQGDVASAAYAGEDIFSRGEPVTSLRAVGGLLAEAIHVIVRSDAPINQLSELRGRRVAIGSAASGTRFDAVAVLAALGIALTDLSEICETPLDDALRRLQRKQIDAVFATGAAPLPLLQRFATNPGFRLVPMDAVTLERLTASRPGLSRLTLPANTYPQQRTPVVTAAATALLLTRADAPASEVERIADLVFVQMPQKRAARADVSRVSSGGDLRGVTVPVHPGAARSQ